MNKESPTVLRILDRLALNHQFWYVLSSLHILFLVSLSVVLNEIILTNLGTDAPRDGGIIKICDQVYVNVWIPFGSLTVIPFVRRAFLGGRAEKSRCFLLVSITLASIMLAYLMDKLVNQVVFPGMSDFQARVWWF